MIGGQKIQVGLAHARKTVQVNVGPDTYPGRRRDRHHRHRSPDH